MSNSTTIHTSSQGAWQGDNPLNYAFPLLIIQITLVISITRTLAFFLKPLRQPKVIAEILGGILLGPSALGRNESFMNTIFPSWSTPILESIASIGLLFFLFLVGLELDISSIRRSGKRALSIALAGISAPFLFGIGITFLLQKVIHVDNSKVGYAQQFMFLGVALSITAFPVLARILAELKLLTTQVGETAMAAAAFNDVAAWILLALAVALAGSGHKSPLISIGVLISGLAFVGFMLLVIKPMMHWLARQSSREHALDEAYICLILTGVLLSGFTTDLIGIHAIFGGFVFGLTIPKGEFAGRIIRRIEDFVSGLLLPLYFASSGLKTNVTNLHGVKALGLLLLVTSSACAGKIFGTFFAAMLCTIPMRESLTLGVLMNTKGLVELIVLNIGKEKKVLTDEMFTVLVLMAIFTTFMTTPAVMAIYKPSRNTVSQTRHDNLQHLPRPKALKDELRILACLHGAGNVTSLISFIESVRTIEKPRLKLYIMDIVELTDRSSSILMVRRNRRNGFPFINRFQQKGFVQDQIASAFATYGQVSKVAIRHLTAVSALSTMHEDICHVAEKKRIEMIVLPFHIQYLRTHDGEEVTQNLGHRWREVNQNVLQRAPCSVAVLVNSRSGMESDAGTTETTSTVRKRVCLVFFGGSDGRKVLELGDRMAGHPEVSLTFLRLESANQDCITEEDKAMDEEAILEFRRKWQGSILYIEKEVREAKNVKEEVLMVAKEEYDLIVVGKGRSISSVVSKPVQEQEEDEDDDVVDCEYPELGPIGDLLVSSVTSISSSLLIVKGQVVGNPIETANKGKQFKQIAEATMSITISSV